MQPIAWTNRVALAGVATVLSCLAGVLVPALATQAPAKKLEVHEWSLWIVDPTIDEANARDRYPSAFPSSVDTTRMRRAPSGKIVPSPASVLVFYGEPAEEVEVAVQASAGRFVAQWPAASVRNRRLRWPPAKLSQQRDESGNVATVADEHWFARARKLDTLWLAQGARSERFVAYDVEFKFAVPLKIEGGPDSFKLANTCQHPLRDVLAVVPVADGIRTGWIDLLPTGKSEQPAGKAVAGKGTAAGKKGETKTEEPKIPPAAQEKLKKPVTVFCENMPLKNAVELLRNASAADIQLDEPALKELAQKPVTLKQEKVPLQDVLDNLANQLDVEFRFDDSGKITITRAKAAGEPAKSAAEPGPTVELALSAPARPGSAEFESATAALRQRLGAAGLTAPEADLLLAMYEEAIFKSGEMIVLCRLPDGAIDEMFPLDVFPEAQKLVRVPLVLVRNIDPRMKDEVKELIARLGNEKFKEREAAEKRLIELGAIAVPALNEALKNPDLEIVFRAERILLSLNQPITK